MNNNTVCVVLETSMVDADVLEATWRFCSKTWFADQRSELNMHGLNILKRGEGGGSYSLSGGMLASNSVGSLVGTLASTMLVSRTTHTVLLFILQRT